jgi:hypothetical protein
MSQIIEMGCIQPGPITNPLAYKLPANPPPDHRVPLAISPDRHNSGRIIPTEEDGIIHSFGEWVSQ